MMRSLYAGVSGLQNHQVRMDVIGNNIANVNTTGFKKGRVNFQDMISQTMSGAARPNEAVGGVNPKQVGLGMTLASIDTIHNQGSSETTGVATDLLVQGEGFFILASGNNEFYTRAGAFGLDNDGTLVNPANGLKVQGWSSQTVEGEVFIDTSADVGDLVIPKGGKDPAFATSQVDLACNLDKRYEAVPPGAGAAEIRRGTWSLDKDLYDSFGNIHRMTISFTKVEGAANTWEATVEVDPEAELPANVIVDVGAANAAGNTFQVNFDNLGTIQSVLDEAGDLLDVGALQVQIGFDVAGATPGADGAPIRQLFNLNLGEVGSAVNAVTQFAEQSSTKAIKQNGFPMGYLENFRIDQSGVITGVYSNGSNRPLGQVALASFTNPGGLEKAGENTYVVSINSGDPNIAPTGVAGKGKIISGALEMSNVDLAEQFTNMIVTQRGFQANSKTIQTSDTMLQELLTLKR